MLFAERFTTRAGEVRIDPTVLLYTLALSVATGLVFGAVPAFTGAFDTAGARDGTRTTHATHAVRNTLIVVQVAASFMLLIGAGLTIRTLINLQRVDPGFQTDHLLTMRIDLNFSKYRAERIPAFWQAFEEKMRAVPGVLAVGGGGTFPLNGQNGFTGTIRIEGREDADDARPRASFHVASPDYFSTIGQPLLAGRSFTRADTARDRPVVIVNQAMARRYWPGQDPVGRKISPGDDRWATVVGVVGDTLQQLAAPPEEEVYLPMFQGGQLSTNWLVRTSVDAKAMERQIRDALRSLDPDQPVDHFRTVAEVRAASLQPPRLTAALLGLFALLALVITATGIAGVIALSVNQRTQEFGIRMALGAQRADVLGMVLRQGLQLVLAGLAIGLAGALVLTRVLSSLLFEVQPTDVLTYLAVSTVVVAVAALACLLPARRAATVNPMIALRVG